jgi:DNA-damage-inducible protein J
VYIVGEVIDMAKTSSLNIRIDPETKLTVDRLFSSFGITVSDAVNIFLHKSIMVGGLPFDVTLPQYNDETLAAMQEARDIASGKIKAKTYASIEELNAELDAEYEQEYGGK